MDITKLVEENEKLKNEITELKAETVTLFIDIY